MKTPSLDLFKLIKSLKTQEKVQFKLYASRKKAGNNYLKLFDAIEAQPEYNEPALKQKFKKEAFIINFDRAKTYLIEAILKCLQEYYSSDSVEALLCNYIQQIEILMNKRLLQLAGKIINKAEALARKHHCHAFLLIILSFKRKMPVTGIKIEKYEHFTKELYLTELTMLEEYRNLVEYKNLYFIVQGLTFKNPENPEKKVVNELTKIIRSPWLKDETMATSYLAKVWYNHILGDVFSLLKELEKSYFFYKNAMDYFEFTKLGNNYKMNIYARAMVPLYHLKMDEELKFLKDKATYLVQSLPDKLKTGALSRVYQALIDNYIGYQLAVGNIHEAHLQSEQIKGFAEKDPSIQGFVVYYGNASLIALYRSDYRKALYCINKVLTMEKKGEREDILLSTKRIALVVHYELGNEDVLSGLCKNYAVYFKSKEDKILLNFFSKILHQQTNKQDRVKAFTMFKKEMELNSPKKRGMDGFDFISWAESKIQNRPIVEILKEKSLKLRKLEG